MNNKFNNNNNNNNNIRVFEECNHCDTVNLSIRKDNKVVASKHVIFDHQNAFPVLKSCRILRKTINNIDIDNNTSPKDKASNKHKMDPADKMMTDGNQDANLPSTLQENNESTLSATAEEDDDATVQTSNSNSTKQAWKSYNIKLLLTSKQDTSDNALQYAMLTIL
jgi:hypothetical protein